MAFCAKSQCSDVLESGGKDAKAVVVLVRVVTPRIRRQRYDAIILKDLMRWAEDVERGTILLRCCDNCLNGCCPVVEEK